jgi:GrpB-like predicted nucleotidyltransferase (UPF0157 family)
MRIHPYIKGPAEFHPSEPVFAQVAAALTVALRSAEPRLAVEHIGSTAVPGCGGKGIIDFAVLYPPGLLGRAKQALDAMGFQRQVGRDPFPESRPMRVGATRWEGREFRIHAHVIEAGCAEHAEVIWFRERLRADGELRQRYQAAKQAILGRGVVDSYDYAMAKGEFVEAVLAEGPRAP